MISLSTKQLISIVNGQVASECNQGFTGVEFDSRKVNSACLFFALPGNLTHGNQFISEAFDKGASLAIVEDNSTLLDRWKSQLVYVENSLIAFSQLASWWRYQLNMPIFGITGSVGKTTVKEMCKHILSQAIGIGTSSMKSYNNHTGVPYSVCQISKEDKWAVLELGMNNPDEISSLTKIVRPTIGCITGIQPVHLAQFRDLDHIASAKFEILKGLEEGSTLVLNSDDPYSLRYVERESLRERQKIKLFGKNKSADMQVASVVSKGLDGISFKLTSKAEETLVDMPIIGNHNAINAACAALLVVSEFPSVPLAEIARSLSTFRLSDMRLDTHPWKNGFIVDDSYNANPASVRSMLSLSAEITNQGKKVGLVLGDMLELGNNEVEFHIETATEVVRSRPCFVISIGKLAREFSLEAKNHNIDSVATENIEQAVEEIKKRTVDVLFVKGSRKMGLDQVVKILLHS